MTEYKMEVENGGGGGGWKMEDNNREWLMEDG